MDWLLINPQIRSIFSSLGSSKGDEYVINPDALNILEDINLKLTHEDQTLRTFRRAISFGQHVRNDLIPVLVNAKDPEVIDATIRILVNLTVPVECLFCVDIMYRTEVGRCTIFELNKLLITSKEAFSDAKCTKLVMGRMKNILHNDKKKLSPNQCDRINNCLLLIRNILHIPETNLTGPHSSGNPTQVQNSSGQITQTTSLQNLILWNLFIQSIDKLLICLMTSPQSSQWGLTIVQVIAIMYKDQHVSTLQKLLNNWFEASLSESSEDNESNTSPPNKCSGDSSPMLTSSDPTSDSSDNGTINAEASNASINVTVSTSKKDTTAIKKEKKDLIAEDRQAILDKETEATLHEVSRKGKEYQDYMLRGQVDEPENQGNKKQNTEEELASEIEKQIQLPAQPTTSTTKDLFTPPQVKTKIEMMKKHQGPQRPQVTKTPHSGLIGSKNGNITGPQKRECPSSTSEISDCGYGTQVENQESISTSSNEDEKPIHQKPPCNQKPRNFRTVTAPTPQEKKEWRRKKLVKRSKSNLINTKGLVQHTPTDEDISNILKEFTVDFLLKGYDHLVRELHAQLLTDLKIPIDTSHFFWLITYFLKFASQLELDIEHVSFVLSFDVINYLVYEGVLLCEQIEIASRLEDNDMKPFLRRIHLVTTAIREFLQALETYKKITHLTQEDRHYLKTLQYQISATENLRTLFLLLIRKFNPNIQSQQYLQDLIVTNHLLLILLDNVTKSDDKHLVNIKMVEHISQFANVDIMYRYGLILQDYVDNGEFVNDCVFTMMHHIAGDLEQVSALFQPIVLKTFSRIWETEFEVNDDWSDLIEYVIHKFMKTPQNNALSINPTSLTKLTKDYNLENNNSNWTQEEKNNLYWYYVQSKKSNDCVGKILKLYNENGGRFKSRISIVQQLLQQDIVTLVEYDDIMKLEDLEYQNDITRKPSLSTESGIDVKELPGEPSNQSNDPMKPTDYIQIIKEMLIKDNNLKIFEWLQKFLLECCYAKIKIDSGVLKNNDFADDEEIGRIRVMESVPFHCILKKKSIPIVAWSIEQEQIMFYQPFVLLLHKLGFQLPIDSGSMFATIPEFWTADLMYNVAKKLGPVDKNSIKFDTTFLKSNEIDSTLMPISELREFDKNEGLLANELFSIPKKHSNSIIRFTPGPVSTPPVPNWLQLVMKNKCTSALSPDENCDSGGVTYDRSDDELSPTAISERVFFHTTQSLIPPITSTQTFAVPPTSNVRVHNSNLSTLETGNSFDEDSAMKSYDDSHDNSSGYQTRRGSQLDSDFSSFGLLPYDSELLNICETASVASDLTRMYVSDEDTVNN